MAELVYARALGARGATHGGSSPLPSTKCEVVKKPLFKGLFYLTFSFKYDTIVPDRIMAFRPILEVFDTQT